jgi:hypothetical protein
MKKPERVEAGQWWVYDGPHCTPFRIGDKPGEVGSEMFYPSKRDRYLGSGDHPEPSERMIETLVDAMSEIENGGPALDEPARGRFDRTNYRQIVRNAIDGKSNDLTYTRCVGVIYRLLRSLGTW